MKKFIKILTACVLCIATLLCITACAPGDIVKAEEKMEGLNYSIVETSPLFATTIKSVYGVEVSEDAKMLYAQKIDGEVRTVYAVYFTNSKDAKLFFEEYVIPHRDDYDKRWELIDQKGKLVVYGSYAGVTDFLN